MLQRFVHPWRKRCWLGLFSANDAFIWSVCQKAAIDDYEPVGGYDLLPPPALYPRPHRELLRALVQVTLGLTKMQVNLRALDKAYCIAFPKSTPLNVEKK